MCQGAMKEKGRKVVTDCYNSKQSKHSKFQLGNKLFAAVLGESDILAKMFLKAVRGNVMDGGHGL